LVAIDGASSGAAVPLARSTGLQEAPEGVLGCWGAAVSRADRGGAEPQHGPGRRLYRYHLSLPLTRRFGTWPGRGRPRRQVPRGPNVAAFTAMEGGTGVTTNGATIPDGADHDDCRMANGTRVAVHNAGFGVSQASRFVCSLR
jgi:hypothetical protein